MTAGLQGGLQGRLYKVDLTGDFKKHSKDSFGGEGDRGMACRGFCVLANETVGIPLGMVVQ